MVLSKLNKKQTRDTAIHTRESTAKAGDCGYARPLDVIKETKKNVKWNG